MTYNQIPVTLGKHRKVTIDPVNWQYDVVQVLVIISENLPEYYIVDFCNEGDTQTIPMTGSSGGVQIPDDFFQDGRSIKGYVVIPESDGAVQTRYEITIPVTMRPTRTDIEPTPSEQSQIDNLIEQMNDVVERSETAAEASETSAGDSAVQATLAESWAVGGTGSRTGEDTDNAKFYSEAAKQAASINGWVKFYIDDDGYLHYVKTANTDLDFYIDENGYLHVTNAKG